MKSDCLPTLLNTRDVADLFSVKIRTVQGWHREKRLPSIKTRRKILFKKEDVMEYLENQK